MNKKIIALMLIVVIIIVGALTVLLLKNNNLKSNSNNETENLSDANTNKDIVNDAQNTETQDDENKNETSNKKSVVIYFSATGNTEEIAKKIQLASNSDILEIKPKQEYTTEDLSYNNDNCRANKEQNDKNARPEIENISNIDNYSIIYLGYPIWWGDVPKVILTLLDNYNFDNKTIIPFCTSGSSGISQSMNTLKSYNKNVNWIEGKRFSNSESENDIKEWINSLNINNKEEENKMYIKINDKTLTASLEDNSSADALIEKLKQNDITIDMHDYSNFEKVGELGFDLPRNDKQISTDFGDLILYQGNNFVIYYDKNNWNFTKLGHIENITQEELKNILGKENVIVTLSLEK